MKKVFLSTTLFLLFIFSSCNLGLYQTLFEEESVESRASSIPELATNQIPSLPENKYSFVLFTDIHVGCKEFDKEKDDFLKWFSVQLENADSTLRPKFLISLGDNMNTGKEDSEYNTYLNKIKKIAKDKVNEPDFKTYSVLGNHDLYHNGWERFKNNIFPYKSAYRFSDGTFSYYFLDSANNTFGKNQRDAIKSTMEADKNAKIVFTHCPFYAGGILIFTMQDTMERNTLLTVFEKNNVKQVFVGHIHHKYGYDYGNWREDSLQSFAKNGTWYLVTVDKTNQTVTFISN